MKLIMFLALAVLLLGENEVQHASGASVLPTGSAASLDGASVSDTDIRTVWLMDLLMPPALAIAGLGLSRLVETVGAVIKGRLVGTGGRLQPPDVARHVTSYHARLTLQPGPEQIEASGDSLADDDERRPIQRRLSRRDLL
jgi:hypothetical protein